MEIVILTPHEEIKIPIAIAISVPGTKGSFQVLNNHAPLISTLEKGFICVDIDAKTTQQYLIDEGLIEVYKNHVSILANHIREL